MYPRHKTLFLSISLVLIVASVRAQEIGPGFVQLAVGRQVKIPYFETYFGEDEQPYLHFNQFMAAVELPIRFDASLNHAAGFLADGITPFSLNLNRMIVEVGKTSHSLPPSSIRLHEGDLFVLWSEIPKWLPATIFWSAQDYELTVTTGYTLPSVEQERRELTRGRLERERADWAKYPLLEREIPWFDPGMLEFRSTAVTGNDRPNALFLNLTGVHRFLKGDLEYSLTQPFVEDQQNEPRLDYYRLRYYDDLRENELTLGDTFTTFSPLVLPFATFRGASFYTGGRLQRFGRTTLIGTAPVDSEADLYRSGILIDFTRVDSRGFYQFDNVPLSAESTLFEVRIFTPDGRALTEFHLVSSQEEMVAPSIFASQGGVGKSTQDLNPFFLKGGEVRYGIFSSLTLGAYVLQLEDFRDIETSELIEHEDSIGAFFLLRPVSWLTLLGEQARDPEATGAATRWNLFFALNFGSLEIDHRNYEEEYAPPARRRTLQYSFPAILQQATEVTGRTRFLAVNTILSTRFSDFGDSRSLTEHGLRMDWRLIRALSFNVELNQERFQEADRTDFGSDEIDFLSFYEFDPLTRLEFRTGYVDPIPGDSSTFATIAYQKTAQIGSPWQYRGSYTEFSNVEDTADASVGYLFSNNIRISFQVDTESRWLLELGYSVPFRVSGDGLEVFPPNFFPRGGLEGVVYVDENGDNLRQETEPVLPDVNIKAPGIDHLVSDDSGRFYGWGLPATDPLEISLDLLTIDALYVPAFEKMRLAVRPGELINLDIPVAPSGGIGGLIITAMPTEISPLEGLEMVLTAEDGTSVATVPVEWDGSFIIEGIRPGTYDLSANRQSLELMGFTLTPERIRVEFPHGLDPVWLDGIEFFAAKFIETPPPELE